MGLIGWLCLSFIIVLFDQVTKIGVSQKLALGEAREVFSFFNILLTHNYGAAFSFLANESGWQRWFFTMVSVLSGLVIIWLLQKGYKQYLFACGLSLILGGAIGNLVDRMWHGYVIDFIDISVSNIHWPAIFNIADIAITIGVILLAFDEILRVRKASKT